MRLINFKRKIFKDYICIFLITKSKAMIGFIIFLVGAAMSYLGLKATYSAGLSIMMLGFMICFIGLVIIAVRFAKWIERSI